MGVFLSPPGRRARLGLCVLFVPPNLLAGAIHTLSTPSTGASEEIQRPSGDSLAPKNVGL
jgi:hypothetical protein